MDAPAPLPLTSEQQYQANRDLLARVKSEEFSRQIDACPLTNLQLNAGPTGALVGAAFEPSMQQWVPLADLQDPLAEARTDADRFYDPKAKVFVLFGMGLGYFARELASRLQPYQRMALFECSPVVYKAAMHAVDLTPLVEGHRVDTFIGDNLEPHLEQWFLTFESHEKLHIAPPMRAGFTNGFQKALYDRLGAKCEDMLRYHAVGLATWQQFGAHIGDNDVANLPEYFAFPGLTALKDCWKGKPAVCVAAGPSLVKNLHQILEIQETRPDMAILSVATVYALLQGLGIIPDLVTTIDFQRLNYTDQVANVPVDPRSALLYLHSAYPDTPRRWPGPTFVARNASDMTQWMLPYAEDKGSAAQVQTVAHLNVVAALEMGCNPIILLGQDLSQPQDLHHAPGARAQDTNVIENPDAHINAEDVYGQPCWTRHSYLSMRTVFTKMFADHPETTFINCTEGGLHIEGAIDQSLGEALAGLPTLPMGHVERLALIVKEIADKYVPQTRWNDLIRDLQGLRDGVAHIGRAAETNIERLSAMGSAPDEEAIQAIKQVILDSESEFTRDGSVFSMIAVRRFDLIQLMSDAPLDGSQPPDELSRIRLERLMAVSRAIAEEYRKVLRNLDGAIIRAQDLLPEREREPLTWREGIRLLARHSYVALQRRLGRAWYAGETQMSLSEWIVLRACVAMHRHEFERASLLLDTICDRQSFAKFDRVQARCRYLLDQYRRGLLPSMAPYLARLNPDGVGAVMAATMPVAPLVESQNGKPAIAAKLELLLDKFIAVIDAP